MTDDPWNEHTPGDPMPCKCMCSVVEVRFGNSEVSTDLSSSWDWGTFELCHDYEITAWRFVERRGEDVIAADTLRLLDEIERLNEALRFYADPEIYKPHPHGPAFERRDLSFVARAALAEGGPDDR